jgi:hypothetical protein
MMTGNTAIHIASQLQSGAPRKAAFLVAVRTRLASADAAEEIACAGIAGR